jgi:fatty-acyl-CoA synthase
MVGNHRATSRLITTNFKSVCLIEGREQNGQHGARREERLRMLIGRILYETARRWPNRVAIIQDEKVLTYDEWNRRVNAVARSLAERFGIRKGDRVGIIAFNSIEQLTAALALQKMGAVYVSINFRLSIDELRYQIEDSGLKVLIFGTELADTVLPCADIVTVLIAIGPERKLSAGVSFADLEGVSDEEPVVAIDQSDPSLIMYTSGTTGRPKGVVLSHAAQYLNTLLCALEMKLTPSDRTLHIAPLFHVAAYHVMLLPHILVGASNIIIRKFEPQTVIAAIREHQITTMLAVPTQFDRIAAEIPDVSHVGTSLRLAFNTGAPIKRRTVEAIRRKITPQLGAVYGLTECSSLLTVLLPEELVRRGADCIGRPLVGVEVRVIEISDEPDVEAVVNRGEAGMLIGRTEKLMDGYLHLPDKTAETIKDGWLLTGDIVVEDQDGYFRLVDRADDMIRSGGENVYPQEVERVLLQHANVADCAVIGVPDEEWGERVKAFIVRRSRDLTADALDAFCLDGRLARYKRPKIIEFVDEIPRNPSGKILRKLLRAPRSVVTQTV